MSLTAEEAAIELQKFISNDGAEILLKWMAAQEAQATANAAAITALDVRVTALETP